MRHLRLPHSLALGLTAAVALTPPAWAKTQETTRLWLERGTDSMPLAQVPDFRLLAQQVVPAVVSIQVEQRLRHPHGTSGGPRGMPQDPFEFFHRYFGGDLPKEYRNRGLGSGFIIDAQGLILTNNHVIEDADTIEVTVAQADGQERKVMAKVLGTAPEYDVALLKTVEPLNGSTIAYLGDSDTTQIGDWVMAVGNPFGLSHSVSVGIISAKERRDVAPSGRQGLYNFLQTDASINPGNSGGPLVNMRGEVIGINSAVNASGAGIGFAIPMNMVKNMLPDLKSKGRFARAWLGVTVQPLTPELARSFRFKTTQGALVTEVLPHSPADEAHIQEGDLVVAFDHHPLRSATDLTLFASMAGVGKRAEVKLIRGGQEVTVSVLLGEFPTSDGPLARGQSTNEVRELGAVLGELTPQLRQQLELDDSVKGVLIQDIDGTGLGARIGLRPGDVLLSLNGRTLSGPQQVLEGIRATRTGEAIRLKVQRGRGRLFLAAIKP